MPEAIFPEGPAIFRGTFHASARFPGRPCVFSGGPSMPEAIFPEGPAFFPGTFHARSHFPGRSCDFQGDLPCQGPFSRKVLRFSGGPSMPEAVFPEGPALFQGTFHTRGRFPGRSVPLQVDLPCQEPFLRKVGAIPGGPSMPGAVFKEGVFN